MGRAQTYWNPTTKKFESVPTGYTGTGVEYQTQQTAKPYYVEPTGLTPAKSVYSPAEKSNITYYNFEPSTPTPNAPSWNVPIARTPTAQEKSTLATQYFPKGTGGFQPSEMTTSYKPRTETVLKNTLSDYISNPLKSVQDLFSNITQGSQGVSPIAQAQGETPTQPSGVNTNIEKKPFYHTNLLTDTTRGMVTWQGETNPDYIKEIVQTQSVRPEEVQKLDQYLEKTNYIGGETAKLGMQRVIEGITANTITPQNVTPKNELAINKELANYTIMPQFYENQQDNNLAEFAQSLGRDVMNVPISDQRLNAVQDEKSLASLWDTGYKAPKVTGYISSVFIQFAQESNIPIWGTDNPEKLKAIKYQSLIDAAHDLTGEGKYSPADFQRMIDDGKTMRLETSYSGEDQFGNSTFSASWNTDVPYEPPKKKSETEAEYWTNWQTDTDHYWDQRTVDQRNAQREESWEWSNNKSLEGWSEYYSALDSLKMAPFMNEWASSTAMFNELRQKWQTVGKGQSWTDFLKGYDFFSQWFAQRPEARGEKPTAFAPILTGTSRL